MMSGQHVLIVEDEAKLAQVLSDYLRQAGFTATSLEDGASVAAWVTEHGPALVILDIMLPEKDGLTVLREIRASSTIPIIMTTARVEEIDRLLGLELGADDYICKPYSPREVVARVKAVLRRGQSDGGGAAANAARAIELDRNRLKVSAAGQAVALTAVEFSLLAALHKTPGRIYSRAALMDLIYRDHRIVSDRTIDSHIKKLRRKLMQLVPHQELIHSVYGVGYRYEESA